METEALQPLPEEQIVSKWEVHFQECGVIPVDGQDELRQILQSGHHVLRDRLIGLLNPRGANIVELSDDTFHKDYFVRTLDNYAPPFGRWAKQLAVFDAQHGYYVEPDIRPLERKRPIDGQ